MRSGCRRRHVSLTYPADQVHVSKELSKDVYWWNLDVYRRWSGGCDMNGKAWDHRCQLTLPFRGETVCQPAPRTTLAFQSLGNALLELLDRRFDPHAWLPDDLDVCNRLCFASDNERAYNQQDASKRVEQHHYEGRQRVEMPTMEVSTQDCGLPKQSSLPCSAIDQGTKFFTPR